VFFENSVCIKCGHTLAFLPDIGVMSSLVMVEGEGWKSPHSETAYRLCENYIKENICNWAVTAAD